MALTNKQVHVELSADDTTRPAHLKVAPMTAQSILLGSVAAAQSPATLAVTVLNPNPGGGSSNAQTFTVK